MSDPTTVDTARERSVSFAPPTRPADLEPGPARTPLPTVASRAAVEGTLVPGGGRSQVNGYPVQPAKVQRPSLRDETLARDRLLDWLHVKIHHRAVFVIAEAGYGKTTLLADFSRRTRMRTLWYRLDEEDRSWIAFLSYLVAAGREHDPGFAPQTAALLREIEGPGPTRRAVVDTFLREFQTLGEQGAVVVLDDFHVVDEAPDVRDIARELLARAPERVTFVIASRRAPSLRVAKLRALGEVAELTTDDLRFNEAETERLFRETYGRPLEADVLDDLSRRTEGWAASLQLVQAAIRDRTSSEVRTFVRSITGAEGELYDYLAEEVVGDLPEPLQDFLMKASILEIVTVSRVQLLTPLGSRAATDLLAATERLGLLGRPQRGGGSRRFHPLVREFLLHRLARDGGRERVRELHLAVAEATRQSEWEVAAYHLAEAGELVSLRRLLEDNLPAIMATGAYQPAHRFLTQLGQTSDLASLRIVASRVAQQRGDLGLASLHAVGAVEAKGPEELTPLTLANLLNVRMNEGDVSEARAVAERLLALKVGGTIDQIAHANLAILNASAGPLGAYRAHLESMVETAEIAQHPQYLAITVLNLSDALRLQGDWPSSLAASGRAVGLLESTSARMELAFAYLNRAWAHAHIGDWGRARADIDRAMAQEVGQWRVEVLALVANLSALYDSPTYAHQRIEEIGSNALPPGLMRPIDLTRARVLAQVGLLEQAAALASAVDRSSTTTPAFDSVWLSTNAFIAALRASVDAHDLADQAVAVAESQGAHFWRKFAVVVRATLGTPSEFAEAMASVLATEPVYASMAAELVVDRLGWLSEEGAVALSSEVERRPNRWNPALRRAVESWQPGESPRAAVLLDLVGERRDVPLLRALGRRTRKMSTITSLGKGLARRRAHLLFVSDLGRVALRCGPTLTPGASLRRKVLSLLCLLLTQPDSSASRDLVLDTLWPDLDPSAALNSLNQTVYFLRRVIEPEYSEDTSPGYVHHEGELVWLDQDLVDSSANRCRRILRRMGEEPSLEDVDDLSREYTGRFAQDFEYEEWAVPFREWLHSSYLETIERSVRLAFERSDFGRAIRLARRALEVDTTAENLEVLLLRAYRQSGAHAAAAEQYSHYAAAHRADLGIDPPPLESL